MPGTEIVRVLMARVKSNKGIKPGDKVSFTMHDMVRNQQAEAIAQKKFLELFGVHLQCGGTKVSRHFSFIFKAAMLQPLPA